MNISQYGVHLTKQSGVASSGKKGEIVRG